MNKLVISYLTLRKSIGIAGMLLFVMVALGNIFAGAEIFEDSISAYYWTSSRDILVGVLFVTGALLLTYNGYDLADRIITSATGVCAFGIALFPCFNTPEPVGYFNLSGDLTGTLHYIFAVLFFILLAVMSWFQFTKGGESPDKLKRNRVYRICAITIVAAIAILFIATITSSIGNSLTYIMETVMLLAFGISWIVKGQGLIRDSS